MISLFAAAPMLVHGQGQGGGVTIHFDALVAVALCATFLIREWRVLTAPRRARRAELREECERYGHQWGDPFQIGWSPLEHTRICQRCKRQQHTNAGRWPGEE